MADQYQNGERQDGKHAISVNALKGEMRDIYSVVNWLGMFNPSRLYNYFGENVLSFIEYWTEIGI